MPLDWMDLRHTCFLAKVSVMSGGPKGNGPAPIAVTVEWDNADLAVHGVAAANAFMIQGAGHEFVLTFGFAVPPFYRQGAKPSSTISAKTIARVALTQERVTELVGFLQQALAAFQAAQKS